MIDLPPSGQKKPTGIDDPRPEYARKGSCRQDAHKRAAGFSAKDAFSRRMRLFMIILTAPFLSICLAAWTG
jgi:hypothetical protein